MKHPRPKIKVDGKWCELLSFDEFRDKKELPHMSNPAIGYNLEMGHLDYTQIGRFRYIVFNKKAKEFELNDRRPHKVSGSI